VKYFSLVAQRGRDKPKTCAMLQASSLEGAARNAKRLISSNALSHVRSGSDFFVRASSRRETSLLQNFLESKTEDVLTTYRKEDLDSLLFRRGSMLLSFFMALYLDPEGMKKRFDANPHRPSGVGGSGGSGGVTMEAAATHDTSIEDQVTEPAESSEPLQDGEGVMSVVVDGDEPVAGDNQISALEDIVNGGSSSQEDEGIEPF